MYVALLMEKTKNGCLPRGDLVHANFIWTENSTCQVLEAQNMSIGKA